MWVVVAFAGAVCGLVSLLMPGRAIRTDLPDPGELAVVLAAGLAALSTVRPWSRPARVLAVVTGLAGGLAAGWWLVDDVRGGLPTAPPALLAFGSLCAVVGALGWSATPGRRLLPAGRSGLAAALVVAALAVAVPTTVLRQAFTSTTVADDGQPALAGGGQQPAGPPSWSWLPPARVVRARAMGDDVVLGLAYDTVVALDGRTGRTTWRYRRPRAVLTALEVAPGAGTVLAVYRAVTGHDSPVVLGVALDAATGEVLWQRPLPDIVGIRGRVSLTGHVLPVRRPTGPDDVAWEGLDLRSGRTLWSWHAPPGCTSPWMLVRHGRQTVLTMLSCPDGFGLAGIDDATGATAWTHVVPHLAAGPEGDVLASAGSSGDGRLVELAVLRAPGPVDPADSRVLLDTATGRVVDRLLGPDDGWADMQSGALPLIQPRDRDRLAAGGPVGTLDPVTGRRYRLDRTGCPGPLRVTTTATAFVSLCPGTLVVQRFDGPRTRVTLPAGVPDEAWSDSVLGEWPVLPLPGTIVLTPASYAEAPLPVVALPVPTQAEP